MAKLRIRLDMSPAAKEQLAAESRMHRLEDLLVELARINRRVNEIQGELNEIQASKAKR